MFALNSVKLLLFLTILKYVSCQLLRPDVMNLGHYDEETKHYIKAKDSPVPIKEPLLGADGHDVVDHRQPLLGGDDHDKVPHNRAILGGDDHDKVPHNRAILGGDGHDQLPHQRPELGKDNHDRVPHHRTLIGDVQGSIPHRRPIFGGDDHDKVPHHRANLGGDDHDKVPHHRPIFGGDDHDKVPHHPILIGGDDHDKVPHHRPIFGGDDHDKVPHHPILIGRDDHDKVPHHRTFIGGDNHDRIPHHRPIFGGDDHDKIPHHRTLIGGDNHDRIPHHRPMFGEDDHDKAPHRANALFSFQSFMQEHGKQYQDAEEFRKRFAIFRQNLQRVKQLRRSERGSATYGVTQFSDLTQEEFSKLLGFRPELRRPSEKRQLVTDIPQLDLPDAYDWRHYNVVTPVKNQGMCGSCWAFSTTGNIEGQWALKHSELISLSEQELVDCDKEDHGCEGGLPENAYDAIEKLGGLESEEQYPYDGHDGTCHVEAAKAKVHVNGSVELPTDETQIAQWLVKNGPISIGINANPLQFYTGGVTHPLRFLCSPNNINHGVLIVGYGTHTTKYLHRVQPYWLVKNSWGRGWGEQGYFRVYRGDGTCGVNLMATSAIVP
ncbi:putative cysteine proteinase CG12163 isoform X1 [Hyalella azteca]|uniref:Cysteine proteinase CG12163 isoform X1 n=1 Tax=Hyalella azteca TaxID=294128 RepID=A0A8B7NUM0_HYAAZ|nr:putative cysteine proteinase CG12163 isoform X1 [Hyalella azteca]